MDNYKIAGFWDDYQNDEHQEIYCDDDFCPPDKPVKRDPLTQDTELISAFMVLTTFAEIIAATYIRYRYLESKKTK